MAPNKKSKAKSPRAAGAGASETSEEGEVLLPHHDENEHLQHENDRPRKSCLYKMFATFSLFSTIVSLLLLATEIATAFVIQAVFIQYVLRAYIVIFCILFVSAELQIQCFLTRCPAFANWFNRGFLYTLIGVVVMEESFATIGQAYP